VRFLSWFGPVPTGPVEGQAFLKQFVTLLQQEWFHGNISEKEAEKRLNADSRNRNKDTFLLRFSKKLCTYTMTLRKKGGELQHERLQKENWTDIPSLILYVEKELRKKRRLQPCSYSRTNYAHLFVKEIVNLYNIVDNVVPPNTEK